MRKRKTTEEFIELAKTIHGDKYDYSKTEYKGAKNKVCIICNEVDEFGKVHGEFWQTPDNHVNSRQGCPKCAKNIPLTTLEFIAKAKLVHGNLYDYSKVDYVNYLTNITIICQEHGEFEQLPANHLKGFGCSSCGRERTDNSKRVNINESINKAINTHNNFYNYSKVSFDKTSDKVTIICPIHGEFTLIWNNHLKGEGCPKCNHSKGEKSVSDYLIEHKIDFIALYRIDIDSNINSSGYAFIDFYLPSLNTFIEYNGIQHYTSVLKFGGAIALERQQKRDQYIRNYCSKNKIKLIEIMYNENVNDKLNKEL